MSWTVVCMYYCYKCLLDLPMQRFIGPFHVLLMPFLKIMIYLLCSRIQCNLSFYVHFKNRKIKWNKATCLRKKMQNKNIIDLFLVIHTISYSTTSTDMKPHRIRASDEIAHCRSCIAGHPLREMPTVCLVNRWAHTYYT